MLQNNKTIDSIRMNLQLLAGEGEEGSGEVINEPGDAEIESPGEQTPDVDNENPNNDFDMDKLSKLIEEKAQELANKVIGKEKKKMKSKLSEVEQQLESERLAKMNESEKMAYNLEKLQKRLEEVESKSSEKDKAIERERISNSTKDVLVSKKLPTSLTNMVMSGTEGNAESILENIKSIESVIEDVVEQRVNERLRTKAPKVGTSTSVGNYSIDEIKNMSPDEINKNWDKISKSKL